MLQQQLGVGANRIRLAHGAAPRKRPPQSGEAPPPETGEVLQDGKSLRDYGITSETHKSVVLDGHWSFKDQVTAAATLTPI